MFLEQLVCPTQLELTESEQLIQANFAQVVFTPTLDPDDFVTEMLLPCTKPFFFRWAATSCIASGSLVLTYCYQLSVDLHDPPPWMRAVLAELHIPYHILSEDNLPPEY